MLEGLDHTAMQRDAWLKAQPSPACCIAGTDPVAKGHARAQRYQWRKIAIAYLELMSEVDARSAISTSPGPAR